MPFVVFASLGVGSLHSRWQRGQVVCGEGLQYYYALCARLQAAAAPPRSPPLARPTPLVQVSTSLALAGEAERAAPDAEVAIMSPSEAIYDYTQLVRAHQECLKWSPGEGHEG